MTDHEDLRAGLRQQAQDIRGRLSPMEREALLIKNWMSHDARWFMAVAREYGMEVANRLNQTAAHGVGKAEAQRLGPDLLDYRVSKVADNAFRVDVQRCFAHDNAVRAGISGTFECGIFARLTGWVDAPGPADG